MTVDVVVVDITSWLLRSPLDWCEVCGLRPAAVELFPPSDGYWTIKACGTCWGASSDKPEFRSYRVQNLGV